MYLLYLSLVAASLDNCFDPPAQDAVSKQIQTVSFQIRATGIDGILAEGQEYGR